MYCVVQGCSVFLGLITAEQIDLGKCLHHVAV